MQSTNSKALCNFTQRVGRFLFCSLFRFLFYGALEVLKIGFFHVPRLKNFQTVFCRNRFNRCNLSFINIDLILNGARLC